LPWPPLFRLSSVPHIFRRDFEKRRQIANIIGSFFTGVVPFQSKIKNVPTMIRQFYLICGLLCFVVSINAQEKYAVHLKSTSITPSANFSETLLQRPNIDASELLSDKYYIRVIQFYAVPSQREQEQLQALGLVFNGYLDFAAYITAVPTHFDLMALSPFNVRSIVPFDQKWKIQDRVNEPKGHEWAMEGDFLKLVLHVYAQIDLKTVILQLNNGALAKTSSIDGEQIRAQVHRDRIVELSALPGIAFIELEQAPGLPEDIGGRSLHRSNMLDNESGVGPKFTGLGVGVLVRDDGAVGPHIDFQGRLNNIATGFGQTHGDGVAGIMAGAGNLNPDNRGMAAGASVFVTNYQSSFTDNTLSLHQNQGVMITNSSYSDGCNDGYTTSTRNVDTQIFGNPSLMHVFSAGNANPQDCDYGAGTQWGNITGGHKQGKNCIATANLDVNGVIASSSSRGPAHDGRIKPDIAAHGQGQASTTEDQLYQSFGGTSAAAPGIAGCMAQLYEAYRSLNNGATPESALIKAALLNTANDLGNIGPDFIFGWGHVNTFKAYQLLESNRYQTGTITQGQVITQNLTIPAGVKQAKVMLYWAEPAAAIAASKALINDLDLKATSPSGVITLPWKLNPAPNATTLAQPAGTGRDSLNNMEQVSITDPLAGNYTLEIKGFAVPSGPQKYWIVIEYLMDEIKVIHPNGKEAFSNTQSTRIHWDAPVGTTGFTLKYSVNAGASWINITTTNASARQFTWAVPANLQSAEMLISVERDQQTDVSDQTFTVSSLVSGFSVTKLCPTEATVSWNMHPQATHYEVFKLGNKYMESVGVTTNTTLTFPHIFNPNLPLWVSIRPILQGIYPGKRLNAIQQVDLKACSAAIDLAAATLVQPSSTVLQSCSQIIQPITVRVTNQSINPISGATIYYQFAGGQIQSEPLPVVNASMGIDHTFAQNLNLNQNGIFELKTWVSHPGDFLFFNDTLKTTLSASVAIASGQIAETFASGVPPTGWSRANPDANSITWASRDVIQSDGTTGPTASINFFSYNIRGHSDFLYSIPTVLTNSGNPTLTFDRSHATYNATYNDGFRVDVYKGCNTLSTPTQVYQKLGTELATAPASTVNWVPTLTSHWDKDTIDLSQFKGDTIIVTLVALNDYGNSLFIDNIQVNQDPTGTAPIAQVSVSQTAPCINSTISYSAVQGNNTNTTYTWTLPNGSIVNGPGPHQWTIDQTGIQSIQLVASNAFGSQTSNQIIDVQAAPSVAFSTTSTAYTVQFTQSATNFTSLTWQFGDGATSTDLNPTHIYAQNGSYQVQVTATGPCGSVTSIQTVIINVGSAPNATIQASTLNICSGQSIQFFAANAVAGTTYTWAFSGGTNTPSGTQGANVTAQFMQNGQFTVMLTATNAFGTNTTQVNVQVQPGVTAQFAVGVNQNSISITNSSQNATTYLFDFGDGTTSTSNNPVHTYAQNGNYTVILTATGPCGTVTSTQQVTINVLAAPVLTWSFSRDTACIYDQIQFFAAPSANTTANITWHFDIGALPNVTTTGAGAQIVWYNQAGQYLVTIIASNAAGSDTVSQMITVLPPPTADFVSNVNGNTVSFTNISSLATGYLWNFGDGATSTQSNPSHTYSQNGLYQVTLTVNGRCGNNSITWPVQIDVQNAPTIQITSQQTSYCAGTNFELTAAGTDATLVNWYLNQVSGQPIATGLGPVSLNLAMSGAYQVIALATNASGADTAYLSINILPNASAAPSFASIANQVQFTANIDAFTNTYSWAFGDGTTSTALDPSHNYTQNGVFEVILFTTNSCGTTEHRLFVTIQVTAPTAAIQASPNSTICIGTEVNFVGLTPPDVLISDWLWNFGAGAAPAQAMGMGGHAVSYASAGQKTVELTVSNFAGANTVTYALDVQAPASLDFQVLSNQLTVEITDQSVGVSQYLWNFGDGASSTEQNPMHTYAINGTYTITLTATNACGTVVKSQNITVTTIDTNEPQIAGIGMSLRPNPSAGLVTLSIAQQVGNQSGTIKVVNVEGRLVFEQKVNFAQGETRLPLDLRHLEAGAYRILVTLGTLRSDLGLVLVR
jgi:PKD repeat protein